MTETDPDWVVISTPDSSTVGARPNLEASSEDNSSDLPAFNEIQEILPTSMPQSSPGSKDEIPKWGQPSPAISRPKSSAISVRDEHCSSTAKNAAQVC